MIPAVLRTIYNLDRKKLFKFSDLWLSSIKLSYHYIMISNYIDVILRPIDSWTLGWLQCQGQEFNMLQMLHRFQIMRFLLNLKIWNKTKSLLILPLCILTQEQITKALCCAPLHYRVRRPLGRFLSQFFFFKSKVLFLSENIARIANAVQVTVWL